MSIKIKEMRASRKVHNSFLTGGQIILKTAEDALRYPEMLSVPA